MVDDLIAALESPAAGGYKAYRQGSVNDYPPAFFTFWNAETEAVRFTNNRERLVRWVFAVCAYSSDPAEPYAMIGAAKAALNAAGFKATGKGYDVASDVDTHTGRGIDVEGWDDP
ncbi:MAG: hypothetical protein LBS91_02965 [Clostridiales Family XIII bacterium]|jgi:hypothetical protein|nr:hypothetical protein [Clostridiales Family XIII bacterium]